MNLPARRLPLAGACLMAAAALPFAGTALAQGTIYKFVAPDGRITYTDQVRNNFV